MDSFCTQLANDLENGYTTGVPERLIQIYKELSAWCELIQYKIDLEMNTRDRMRQQVLSNNLLKHIQCVWQEKVHEFYSSDGQKRRNSRGDFRDTLAQLYINHKNRVSVHNSAPTSTSIPSNDHQVVPTTTTNTESTTNHLESDSRMDKLKVVNSTKMEEEKENVHVVPLSSSNNETQSYTKQNEFLIPQRHSIQNESHEVDEEEDDGDDEIYYFSSSSNTTAQQDVYQYEQNQNSIKKIEYVLLDDDDLEEEEDDENETFSAYNIPYYYVNLDKEVEEKETEIETEMKVENASVYQSTIKCVNGDTDEKKRNEHQQDEEEEGMRKPIYTYESFCHPKHFNDDDDEKVEEKEVNSNEPSSKTMKFEKTKLTITITTPDQQKQQLNKTIPSIHFGDIPAAMEERLYPRRKDHCIKDELELQQDLSIEPNSAINLNEISFLSSNSSSPSQSPTISSISSDRKENYGYTSKKALEDEEESIISDELSNDFVQDDDLSDLNESTYSSSTSFLSKFENDEEEEEEEENSMILSAKSIESISSQSTLIQDNSFEDVLNNFTKLELSEKTKEIKILNDEVEIEEEKEEENDLSIINEDEYLEKYLSTRRDSGFSEEVL